MTSESSLQMSKCLCYPTKKINSELRVRNYLFQQLSNITQNTLKSIGPAEVGEAEIKFTDCTGRNTEQLNISEVVSEVPAII